MEAGTEKGFSVQHVLVANHAISPQRFQVVKPHPIALPRREAPAG